LEAIELIEHGQIVAIFANGKRQVGSMVIGADGPNSTVREILFGRKRAQINPTDATWMPSPWHTRGGRMTLAGDAAHTMANNGERGLENALVDAHNLVATIKNIVAGNLVRAAAIPSYSLEVAARGAKEVEASRDIAESILDAGSLDKRGLIPRITATTPGNPAPKATRARRAWSHARLWMVGKVENLDRGAREGTAQTGWAQLGQRAYGRSHFPPDSM
jgi:2-polyprenyl-6-methoxyphenol hydroxylase-like FAD-dependent oxidoreductase